MIENVGQIKNPPKCNYRTFLIKADSIEEISFQREGELNHEAFMKGKPYPFVIHINEQALSFEKGDYTIRFKRVDLEEILTACPASSFVPKESSQ